MTIQTLVVTKYNEKDDFIYNNSNKKDKILRNKPNEKCTKLACGKTKNPRVTELVLRK